MSKVSDAPKDAMADNYLEITSAELDALRAAVEDADGRKSEVQLARDVLGV